MRPSSWLRYDTALIALGVVLLLNPLYVGALHLDDPNWYRYEATEVAFTDDGIDAPADAFPFDDDAACLDRRYRICLLERHVHERNVSYPERMAAGPGDGYRYAYIDDQFYQVQPQRLGGSGNLSHEPLPREEALGYVSTPLDEVSPAVREAVTSGSVETHRELDGANELVRYRGDYYVVHATAYSVHGTSYGSKKLEGQIIEGGLSVAGIAAGLWLVLRGQRHRLRRAWH